MTELLKYSHFLNYLDLESPLIEVNTPRLNARIRLSTQTLGVLRRIATATPARPHTGDGDLEKKQLGVWRFNGKSLENRKRVGRESVDIQRLESTMMCA